MLPSPSLNIDQAIRLALECHAGGKFDRALELYEQLSAVLSTDQNAALQTNIGLALRSLGRVDEAIAAHRRAVEASPQLSQPLNNLANALLQTGQLDEAIALFDRALLIAPQDAQVVNNRAAALEASGRIDDAIFGYTHATELAPNDPSPFDNLVYAMHFSPRFSARDIFQAHQKWASRFADSLKPKWPVHANDRSLTRKLRIGFVSADLKKHAVGRFLLPLLVEHDRSAFDMICYSATFDPPDELTAAMRSEADGWQLIATMSDAQASQKIIDDRIDILIDLSLHMSGNRLGVFARKPAPVQATYLAYPGTSGLEAIDYRITDPHLDPIDGDVSMYVERSIRLPQTYWCYQPMAEALALPVARAIGNVITFGCLNNFNKCSIDARNAWRTILSRTPNSRLILHARMGRHRDDLLEYFETGSIDRSRIEFVANLPPADYFAMYNRIDIALDPFPYGGGTTTCDALWMGTPVITLRGQTAVGRGAVSILKNIGHPELIAETREQYVLLAIDLANDRRRLFMLHSTLRQHMQSSTLMRTTQFAQDFEKLLSEMWENRFATEARTQVSDSAAVTS